MGRNKGIITLLVIFLIIIIIFMGLVIYAKFIRNNHQDNKPNNTPKPQVYITTDYIVSNFNENNYIKDLNQENTIITMTKKSNNEISVTYKYEDYTRNFDITIKDKIMTLKCSSSDKNIMALIVSTLLNITNTYLENPSDYEETVYKINNNNYHTDGINLTINENTYTYNIDISKKIKPYTPSRILTTSTMINIGDYDYYIENTTTRISRVNIINNTIDKNILLNIYITNLTPSINKATILFKAYDKNNNEISKKEIPYEMEEDTVSMQTTIDIELPSLLQYSDISKYSLEIIK